MSGVSAEPVWLEPHSCADADISAGTSATGDSKAQDIRRERLTRTLEIAESHGAYAFEQWVRRDLERIKS
ncbi:hypothetical protein [Hoeflea prorocentri]|uniref:Uncharacterized protein n=1 Tax=Hoeflea prorocentri TaxID=1922333 RepID=A0A9X3ZG95_9HYPH|nr:hypothetical protein [Hoeflea prorocentri]MCY6379515.1 hypothetical protein [Hoeflea prorocentri]MDA5397315.1 hypothetical protein [Hoeflea prorocentri]